MASEEMIFCVCKFSLSVKISETFLKISAVGTCSNPGVAINANLHISHYKSVETIKCHSKQSSYPIGTQKHIFYRNYIVLLVNYLIFRRACSLIQVQIVHY